MNANKRMQPDHIAALRLQYGRRSDALSTMKIPTKADWGKVNHGDLDADYAYKQFFGKSYEDAIEMFKRNALHYQEDLQSMPTAAFNFYAPAFAEYITSAEAAEDSDGASSFLHMVSWMIKTDRKKIFPETEQLLLVAAENVAGNQAFYDADIDIYGKFQNIYAQIQCYAKCRI